MKKNYTMPQLEEITLQSGEKLMWELEFSWDKAEHSAPERHPAGLRQQW
jgi:hypothetical protein